MTLKNRNFEKSFKAASNFHDRNITYLLGRAFARMHTDFISLRTIAYYFDITKESVTRAIDVYETEEILNKQNEG